MAKQTTVVIYDDLDGTPGASRVPFAYRGTSYEIDLSDENQAKLGAALTPYIMAARKTGRIPSSSSRGASRHRNLVAVRVWAREHGFEVSDYGRVPVEVQQAYDAAH